MPSCKKVKLQWHKFWKKQEESDNLLQLCIGGKDKIR